MSGSSTLCVFVLYGFEPGQCKQMSVSISGGCTSTVTQRNSYRKRLAAFGLILVRFREVVMREGLKCWMVAERDMWVFRVREM